MATRKLIWAASALAVVGLVIAAPVSGQTFDKRTVFTFDRPFSVPGVTLPAGDYMFRIVNTESSRNVIQVLSGDGKTPYAMLHSIPDVRTEASADPAVRFMETAKGQPSAVKTWWYPHERTGYEFIYPKDQARRLAEEVQQPVLTTHEETTKVEEVKPEELVRIEPSGREEPVVVPEREAIVAEAQPAPEPRAELPVTATSLPALGLLGVLALALAAGLRVWRSARA